MILRTLAFSFICLLCSAGAIAEQLLANVYPIENVHELVVGGGATVEITQGDTESLRAIGRQDVLDRVSVDVTRGRLKLGVKSSSHGGFFDWLKNSHDEIKFVLQVKNLSSISLSGGVYAEAGDFTAETLDIDLSGSSRMKMGEARVQELTLDASGAGRLNLAALNGESLDVELSGASFMEITGSGNVKTLDIGASGASKFYANNVTGNHAIVSASGASHIGLRVTDTLEGHASGASHINYSGNPKAQVHSSGASSIQSQGE